MSERVHRISIMLGFICLVSLIACGRRANTVSPPAAVSPSPISIPAGTAALPISPPTEAPTPTSPPPTEAPTEAPTMTSAPVVDNAPPPPPPAAGSPEDIDLKLGFHTTLAAGVQHYVIIRADFPDVKRSLSEAKLSERMLKFLSSYFYQASYQQLKFEGSMTKRYILPHPVAYYKISPRNLEVDDTRVLALLNDAINAADADIEFTPDLFVMIALGATHEEYGMVGYCALPGMLGFQNETPFTAMSGEVVKNVAVFCENAHLGTYVHDTLHMLGGVIEGQRITPCLYDHDLQAKYPSGEDWAKNLINIGYWDPLSSHFAYRRDLPPSGLTSWTKLRLGWIEPAKIAIVNPSETQQIRLDPLTSESAGTLVIKIPLSETTYYLIENRQQEGSDVNLPSSGVLILYADDSVPECRHGNTPVKIMDANPDVPLMNDAAYDIGKKAVFIDPGHNLAVVLLSKEGQSYNVLITTPDQVGAIPNKRVCNKSGG